jgi:hypothetical protein
LLTADKALELRQYKEATGKTTGRQIAGYVASSVGGSAAAGGIAAAASGDGSRLENALTTGALGLAGAGVAAVGLRGYRKLERGATTRAIKQGLKDEAALAAGVIPDRNKLGTSGRIAAKVAPPYVAKWTKPEETSEDDFTDLFE